MADTDSTPVKACVKCGATDRNGSGKCRPCKKLISARRYQAKSEQIKAAATAWRAANSGRDREYSRLKYEANKEAVKAAANAWNRAHPERVKANSKAWKAANPAGRTEQKQNRRARRAGGRLSRGLIKKLFALQRGKCPCCSLPLGNDYHLDHKMPLALGGRNVDDNMQLLRKSCNLQKHAKHPVDFMQSRGFLL